MLRMCVHILKRMLLPKNMTIFILFILVILSSMYHYLSHIRLLLNSRKIQISNNPIHLPNVVVHLDFKGMPPKLSYLKSLLPKLHELGVTGFLVEYEDMFPYEGKLANLRSKYAYKKTELQNFLKMVASLGFDIIPLIPTFGHMEFVLKLKEFEHLREVPYHSNVICPSKRESQILIRDMLEQVVKFHQNIFPLKYFHIGSDEVYHIKQCKLCLRRNETYTNIFLNHVKGTTSFLKNLSPKTTILMWEDMLRRVTMDEWFNVKGLRIEPVYWDYTTKLKLSHVALNKYHKTFDNIWIASAFKGADGKVSTIPRIKDRLSNHLNLMKFIQNYRFGGEYSVYSFRGIILTGWSRYSHTATPCDLLPVSIPSLLLNLFLIKKFKNGNNYFLSSEDVIDFYNKNLKDDIDELLECPDELDIDSFNTNTCHFNGNDLCKSLDQCDKFISYVLSEGIEADAKWYNQTCNELVLVEDKIKKTLSRYYDKHFVDEYVNYKLRDVKRNLLKKNDMKSLFDSRHL